jgi:hypothetical protein
VKNFITDSEEWTTENEEKKTTKSSTTFDQILSNHVISSESNASHVHSSFSFLTSRADQLILKNSTSTHLEKNSTLLEDDYESVEKWVGFLDIWVIENGGRHFERRHLLRETFMKSSKEIRDQN